MVTIRNGYDAKSSSSSLFKHLPQLITIFFLMAFSFYGGILVGMHLQVHQPVESNNSVKAVAANAEEIQKQVELEVQRRMDATKLANNAAGTNKEKKTAKSNDTTARFPKTVEKFAAGISLVSKNDFLTNFDYGIPKVMPSYSDEYVSTQCKPEDTLFATLLYYLITSNVKATIKKSA